MARGKATVAEALANPVGNLRSFEDKYVLRAAIEIPNASGGLREAMKFEPIELEHDQEVFVVLACRVKKVRFDEITDEDDELLGLVRVHVFDAKEAALIDGDAVAEHLSAQRDRIQRAKDDAAGQGRLDVAAEDVDQLVAQHEAGEHADLADGCPACEVERDLAATGR